MSLTRRGFLGRLAAVAVGAVAAARYRPEPTQTASTSPSIKYVTHYNVRADQFVSRLDLLYGHALVRPAYAVRVLA